MTSPHTLAPKMDVQKEIQNTVALNYGNRIFPNHIETLENGSYLIDFSYSRPFTVKDETNKTIYVRSFYLENIYSLECTSIKHLTLPINEINHNIATELLHFQKELEEKVLDNKELMKKLFSYPLFGYYLTRFRKILNRLIVYGTFEPGEKEQALFSNSSTKKTYKDILEASGFIEQHEEAYIASNKLKQILEENKSRTSSPIKETIEDVLYHTIREHYRMIVHELGLVALQSYIDLLSSIYYLNYYHDLKRPSLDSLYTIYRQVFRKQDSKEMFTDRLNDLQFYSVIDENFALS